MICGDFNCPGLDGTHIDDRLESVLDCFDLEQHVNTETRSHNLLDLLITVSSADKISDIEVHDAGCISDHRLVMCKMTDQKITHQVKQYQYRDIKSINLTKFKTKVKQSELFTNPASTPDEYLHQLKTVVTGALDDVAPLRTKKKPSGQKNNRWLSDEARDSKRQRRRLERRWKAKGDEATRVEYRRVCRTTNRLITDCRRKFFQDKIAETDDCRSRWRVVKDLLHSNRSNVVRPPGEVLQFCKSVARFFQDKVTRIKTSISDRLQGIIGDKFTWDKPHLGPLFDNVPSVTISEVTNILRTMPSKSSPLDFIPTSLLKNCSDIFAPIICTLANLSFSDGNFPAAFKNAQITPLLKKPGLDADSPENYRPISNLNTISKILEKLFSSRLKEHIRLSSNLNPFQSAYRQFHSTETALLRIMNDIFTSIDGKKITILVALDLSAAFDTIDHSALLHRMEYTFGISGLALQWISTYLMVGINMSK